MRAPPRRLRYVGRRLLRRRLLRRRRRRRRRRHRRRRRSSSRSRSRSLPLEELEASRAALLALAQLRRTDCVAGE